MLHQVKSLVGLSLGFGFLIGACSTPVPQVTPTPPQPTAASANRDQSPFNDPFAYCAAVGTVDSPDERYNGPQMPDAVIRGMIQQGIVSTAAPAEFQKSALWRCMNGQVWICHFGANLPCQEKADTAQTPSTAMKDYCQANPTAEIIPAVVTGRATVYEWQCQAGEPQVIRQIFQVDPRGYLADFWYELTPLN